MASFTKFIEEIPALQEYFNTFSKKLMILCLQVTTHPAIAIEASLKTSIFSPTAKSCTIFIAK
jgi:hypothetical protein